MALLDSAREQLELLRSLTPAGLKRLAHRRISELVLGELGRARRRIGELERRYPSAPPRELAQRLIDRKKQVASSVGGVSGMFGLLSLPADLLAMAWLELTLLVEVATLYKRNLKSPPERGQLLDLLGQAHGVGPLKRAGPRVLGRLAAVLFEANGLSAVGRAVPLIAAPVTAYLNHRHIQRVGDEAIRFYAGFERAREKNRKRDAESA